MGVKAGLKSIKDIPGVAKVMAGAYLIWEAVQGLVYKKIGSHGAKTYYEFVGEPYTQYTVFIDKSTYVDVGYSNNGQSLLYGNVSSYEHTFRTQMNPRIIITVWSGAEITKIVTGR